MGSGELKAALAGSQTGREKTAEIHFFCSKPLCGQFIDRANDFDYMYCFNKNHM